MKAITAIMFPVLFLSIVKSSASNLPHGRVNPPWPYTPLEKSHLSPGRNPNPASQPSRPGAEGPGGDMVANGFKTVGNDAWKAAKGFGSIVEGPAKSFGNKIGDVAQDAGGKTVNAFKSAGSQVENIGHSIWSGLGF